MFNSIFLNVGFLVILLYLIRALSKESKLFSNRYTLIVGALLIINIFATYHYLQIKSSYNTSTYNLYRLTSDSMGQMRQIVYEDTENMEDIFVLNQVIEDIYIHTHLLLMQLDNTKLVSRKQHQQLHTIIDDFSEQLGMFLGHNNGILGRGEEIEGEKFKQYDQLKSKLFNFAYYFRSGGSSSGVRFGIMQYKLTLDDRNISRLQNIVVEISEIVADLTSEN